MMRNTLFAGLLAVLVLFAACVTPDAPPPAQGSAESIVRAALKGVTDAAMRMDGTAALRKYAPEAIAILDTPTIVKKPGEPDVTVPADGVVSIDELVAVFVASTPEELAARMVWLAILTRELVENRKSSP